MSMPVRIPLHLLTAALALAIHGNAFAQHDHAEHGTATETAEEPAHTGHGQDDADAGAPTAADPADHSRMDHSKMDHSKMDHSQTEHSQVEHGQEAKEPPPKDHAAMGHGGRAPEMPKEPIPEITDADRAAAFPPVSHDAMEHASPIHYRVLFNRLETWDADHGDGQAWEGSAWVGSDVNRLWLRSEGEREHGRTEASDLEVLYGRSVSAWWDVLAGVKQEFRPGDSRSWAAFGVQGLAPYKFEVSATAYVGESGQVAATVEAEYELLLTNRLILQPLVEAHFSAKHEPEYGNGSGLNTIEAGIRLRYEIDRRFAPYLGVVHERAFGGTADYHRAAGEDVRDTRVVAGVRIWF
jgi:copper resistance protein B